MSRYSLKISTCDCLSSFSLVLLDTILIGSPKQYELIVLVAAQALPIVILLLMSPRWVFSFSQYFWSLKSTSKSSSSTAAFFLCKGIASLRILAIMSTSCSASPVNCLLVLMSSLPLYWSFMLVNKIAPSTCCYLENNTKK